MIQKWLEFRGRLKTKFYDKRDDFTFPIVNIPFISSNIPALLAYGVYIAQLVRYYSACIQNSDIQYSNKATLILGWSHCFKILTGLPQELIDPYGISISLLTTDIFHFS